MSDKNSSLETIDSWRCRLENHLHKNDIPKNAFARMLKVAVTCLSETITGKRAHKRTIEGCGYILKEHTAHYIEKDPSKKQLF